MLDCQVSTERSSAAKRCSSVPPLRSSPGLRLQRLISTVCYRGRRRRKNVHFDRAQAANSLAADYALISGSHAPLSFFVGLVSGRRRQGLAWLTLVCCSLIGYFTNISCPALALSSSSIFPPA